MQLPRIDKTLDRFYSLENIDNETENIIVSLIRAYIYIYIYIWGAYNNFPDFFRMGTFIDSTHMKL